MKILLLFLPLIAFAFPVSNERVIEADQIKVLDSTYVTLKNDIDMDSNNIFGITDLTVIGNTTLNVLLNGPLKSTAGLVSSGLIDLPTETTGILSVDKGGTNSVAALVNDLIMISTGGAIVESSTASSQLLFLDATSSIQTQIDSKANDVDVVKLVGDQTVSGVKTFDGKLVTSSTVNGSKPAPEMTEAQRDLIVGMVSGDQIYNLDTNQYNYFDGTDWKAFGSGSGSGGGSYRAGGMVFSGSGCLWSKSSVADWNDFPVNGNCNYAPSGDITAPDTNIPAIKIPSARSDGYYKINFSGLLASRRLGAVEYACRFGFSSQSGSEPVNKVYSSTPDVAGNTFNSISGVGAEFRFTGNSDETVRLVSYSTVTGGRCTVYGRTGDFLESSMFLDFYPDSAKSIETADYTRGHARYYAGLNVVVGGTSVPLPFDTIYPNTLDTLGKFDPVTGVFTETEADKCYEFTSSMWATPNANNVFFFFLNSSVNGQILTKYATSPSMSGNITRATISSGRYCTILGETIKVEARESTVNGGLLTFIDILESPSSGAINGDFAEIESDLLVNEKQKDNTAQTVPNATDTLIDNISYTITKDSNYDINYQSSLVDSGNFGFFVIRIRINGSVVGDESGSNFTLKSDNNFVSASGYIKNLPLSIGDIVRVEVFQNTGAARSFNHTRLDVNERPSKASIVHNIIGEQTTECQTKFLSSTVITSGTVSDLVFNNLDITKNYDLTLNVRMVSGSNNCTVSYSDASGIILANKLQGDSAGPEDRYTQATTRPIFKPLSTTITPTFTENTNCLLEASADISSSSIDRFRFTWATLCELPATTVTTTKFN